MAFKHGTPIVVGRNPLEPWEGEPLVPLACAECGKRQMFPVLTGARIENQKQQPGCAQCVRVRLTKRAINYAA